MSNVPGHNRLRTNHLALLAALAALACANAVQAAPITTEFSASFSIDATGTPESGSLSGFPGSGVSGSNALEDFDTDTGVVNFAGIEANAIDQGNGSLDFFHIASGAGEHSLSATTTATTSLTNSSGGDLYGFLEFNIIAGQVGLTDYISDFAPNGAEGDISAAFDFTISVNGLDVIVASASVTASDGDATPTVSVNGDATLLNGATVVNDPGASGVDNDGVGSSIFSWNDTTGVIDLGLLQDGTFAEVVFSLTTTLSGTQSCGGLSCPRTTSWFRDPPGFGRIMRMSLQTDENPYQINPQDVPELFAAMDTPNGPITQTPTDRPSASVPEPGSLPLLLAGLVMIGWRRLRESLQG